MEINDYSLPKTPPKLMLSKHNDIIIDFKIDVCSYYLNNVKYYYGIIYKFFNINRQIMQTQILTNIGIIKPKKLQNYEIIAYKNIDDLWFNIANQSNYNHFAEQLKRSILTSIKLNELNK